MGWLNSLLGTPENAGTFSDGAESYPPRRFGVLSVKWSLQAASEVIDTLAQNPANADNIVSHIKQKPAAAKCEAAVLAIAAHLAYVKVVLKVSDEVVREVVAGITEALTIALQKPKLVDRMVFGARIRYVSLAVDLQKEDAGLYVYEDTIQASLLEMQNYYPGAEWAEPMNPMMFHMALHGLMATAIDDLIKRKVAFAA